eukprot:1521843-Rhodomonas_salina.1
MPYAATSLKSYHQCSLSGRIQYPVFAIMRPVLMPTGTPYSVCRSQCSCLTSLAAREMRPVLMLNIVKRSLTARVSSASAHA